MGAGATAKVNRRYEAYAVQHAAAEAETECMRRAERPVQGSSVLTMKQLARGQRNMHPCPDCGTQMEARHSAKGVSYVCGTCFRTHDQDKLADRVILWGICRASGRDEAGPFDEASTEHSERCSSKGSTRRPSKEERRPSKDQVSHRSGSKQSTASLQDMRPSKEQMSHRSGSKQSTASLQDRRPSKDQMSHRSSSKQSTGSNLSGQTPKRISYETYGKTDEPAHNTGHSAPRVVHRRASIQRRSSSLGALMALDDPLQGFAVGDRVTFEDYDEVAAEFGIGTVLGPTAVLGVLSVRFDTHEPEKAFNLKADGLKRLSVSQEAAVKAHGNKPIRRSTIG